jgi:hypothetical protein
MEEVVEEAAHAARVVALLRWRQRLRVAHVDLRRLAELLGPGDDPLGLGDGGEEHLLEADLHEPARLALGVEHGPHVCHVGGGRLLDPGVGPGAQGVDGDLGVTRASPLVVVSGMGAAADESHAQAALILEAVGGTAVGPGCS